jgi:hypothetical protein
LSQQYNENTYGTTGKTYAIFAAEEVPIWDTTGGITFLETIMGHSFELGVYDQPI